MYHYSPPKSNLWGHALRQMPPARQKALFGAFLEQAVAKCVWTGGSLSLYAGPAPTFLPPAAQGLWGHVTAADVKRFEELLGATARDGGFYSLTPQQCDAALDELIQHPTLVPGSMLLSAVDISQWLIEGKPVETQSRVTLYYGFKPCLSTFLEFETTGQFEFIKRVLADLDLCKLNDKHLKPNKRGATKKKGGGADGE